jgi:glycosyltransferase involved in cell wall biosynthesis
LIKKRFNTPYVITEHWSRYKPEVDNYHGWIRKKVTQKVVKAAAAVMPVTHDLERVMQSHKLINKKYTVISNVVDTKLFTPRKQPLGKRYFIHVSTFGDDVKNITGMLRVVKKINEHCPGFLFKIIGTGEDEEAVKGYAKKIGLVDEVVCFEGPMQKHEVAEQMKNAMFLVMFSNYENMPVVICEAMACGIPVITTRVGGIDEVVDEKCGILILPKDEKGLYEAIRNMLDNSESYNTDYIRKKALTNFSMNSVGSKIVSIYESVISGHV